MRQWLLGTNLCRGFLSRLTPGNSVGTVAELIDRRSFSRLNGGCDKDPVSLPMRVAASVVVLPFVMGFYLGGFGVKRQVQEALLGCALGSRSLE
jgi:hypothetical protein